jgi:hypothetical protein
LAAPDEFFIYIPAVETPETAIGPFGSGDNAPIFKLRGFTGVADTFIQPQTEKHPFQIGETFLNTDTTPRIITIFLRVIPGAFGTDSFILRNFLARSMMVEQITPREPGDKPQLGFLRYFREGFIPVQLPVIPRSSPRITFIGRPDKVFDAELEFFAPFPYWEDITTNTVNFIPGTIAPADDLQMPFEFPFEFDASSADVSVTQSINNTGDVRTPITVQVFGRIDDGFSLINNTIGERIDINGSLAQGDIIEIKTEFGQKSVTLISDSTRTNAMSRVDFETTIFWELAKGVNSVTFEATGAGSTAQAVLTFKNRYAGV